jgi:CheY-like chemotaxis protein
MILDVLMPGLDGLEVARQTPPRGQPAPDSHAHSPRGGGRPRGGARRRRRTTT